MAVNKRKILESAQKHLQKGALDKALEDYQTLLKADPRDSNTRLKVGDLHLKLGRSQDAIDAYLRVAQQFTNEGFDAKAVALYKQIAKLDDKRFEVHAQLGELYQRMGLTSEAMKALQSAADGAYRAGDKSQALGLLRRMAALDPSNTTNRLKVADLLKVEGKAEDAVAEYEEVARELERQNNGEERVRVLERLLELAPDHAASLRALAEGARATGAHAKAVAAARKLVANAPSDDAALELLGQTLEAAGEAEPAAEAFRELAERLRARGDDDRARALTQRYGTGAATFGDGESDAAVLEGDAELELDPELDTSLGLDELPLETSAGADQTLQDVDPPSISDALEPIDDEDPTADGETSAAEIDADADVEQLLAEASVFSRYGKHDRAVETLRGALRVEPGNAHALEKLGSSLLAMGNKAHAISSLQRAGAAFSAAGDATATARVRDLLKPLDAKAAASFAVPEPPVEAESTASDLSEEIDIEIDDAGSDATPAPAVEADEPDELDIEVAPPSEPKSAEQDFAGIEFEISSEESDVEAAPAPTAAAAPQVDESGDISFDVSMDDEPAATPEPSETSEATGGGVEADLEEAEFYATQGMQDEARTLLERVLAASPDHPRALARLRDLGAAPSPAAPEPVVESTGDVEFKLDDDEPSAAPEPVAQAAPRLAMPEAPPAAAVAAPPPVAAAASAASLQFELEPEPEVEPLPAGDAFDLAAELAGAMGNDAPSAAARGMEGEGFQEVFAAFKAGVQREVGDGDTEAHYDLGIAYKEMGLLDDAIGEFRIAMGDPARKLACLHLMGVCALDLGRPADAEAHLSQALAGGALPAQQEAALRVDLGRVYRALGDPARARAAYEAARRADPSFEGIDALLDELETAAVAPAAEKNAGESFESFDDLMGEEAASATAVPATPAKPAFESFDDLIEEAEPVDSAEPAPVADEMVLDEVVESPADDPVEAPEPEPTAPARPATPPAAKAKPAPEGGPARRKKKISFV